MPSVVRPMLLVCGCLSLLLALGFYLQVDGATRLWPWTDGRLSYIFLGSILAAIAAPILWIGLTGELGASRAGALNLLLPSVAGSAYFAWLWLERDAGSLLVAALVFAGLAAINFVVFLWSRRIPLRDTRPTPTLVRASFAVFAIALILVGSALVMRADHIFPWPLKPESSLMFGMIFLGAAVYFIYATLVPVWTNAVGQLLGFLAYDLVLIVPFLDHFSAVKDDHRLSLMIYLAVILYSAALSIYYLAIHPATRLFATPDAAEHPVSA